MTPFGSRHSSIRSIALIVIATLGILIILPATLAAAGS